MFKNSAEILSVCAFVLRHYAIRPHCGGTAWLMVLRQWPLGSDAPNFSWLIEPIDNPQAHASMSDALEKAMRKAMDGFDVRRFQNRRVIRKKATPIRRGEGVYAFRGVISRPDYFEPIDEPSEDLGLSVEDIAALDEISSYGVDTPPVDHAPSPRLPLPVIHPVESPMAVATPNVDVVYAPPMSTRMVEVGGVAFGRFSAEADGPVAVTPRRQVPLPLQPPPGLERVKKEIAPVPVAPPIAKPKVPAIMTPALLYSIAAEAGARTPEEYDMAIRSMRRVESIYNNIPPQVLMGIFGDARQLSANASSAGDKVTINID